MKFIYIDYYQAHWLYPKPPELHGHWINVILFVWSGSSILEADKAFEAKLGYAPDKKKNVGCRIFKDEENPLTYLG